METVLVTGGNGFIGGYVVNELLDRGYRPLVLDARGRAPIVAAELIFGDIRDETSITEAVAHVDGVIHLAGVLGTQETIDNPRPAVETNLLGGLNVIEACLQYDLPLVNISVGNHWMQNTYAITKSAVERFAEMANHYRNGRITTVRGLNAYGPRQTPAAPFGPSKVRKVMPSFICRALTGKPIEVYGDGEQVMDMIFVSDLARVLVSALETTAEMGPQPTMEAGTGRKTTILEIAQAVQDEVLRLKRWTSPIEHLPMRPGETERAIVVGDPLTLTPIGMDGSDFIPLEEGVRRTVAYYHSYLEFRSQVKSTTAVA